jgi:hypothetical protein
MAKVYEIMPIAGKGLGILTTQKITKGTRIISERPLFKITQHESKLSEYLIAEQLLTLTDNEQDTFFALSNRKPDPNQPLTAILGANAFRTISNDVAAVFNELSRINHACNPNMMTVWNEDYETMTAIALRDIRKGEELTISYLGGLTGFEARQRHLKEVYNFECGCGLCTLLPEQRAESDKRRQLITHVLDEMGQPTFHNLHLCLQLLVEEGISSGEKIDEVYFRAAQLAIAEKDKVRAMLFRYRGQGMELDQSTPADEYSRFNDCMKAKMGEKGLEKWLWEG